VQKGIKPKTKKKETNREKKNLPNGTTSQIKKVRGRRQNYKTFFLARYTILHAWGHTTDLLRQDKEEQRKNIQEQLLSPSRQTIGEIFKERGRG